MSANAEKNRDIPISISHHGSNWRPKLNIDKKGKYCYPKWDLKDELVAGLRCEITDRLNAGGIHGEERRNVITELFKGLTQELEKSEYPSLAPELYKDREKRDFDGVHRKEKPDEFVRRVYKKWLHQVGGLPRPVLRDLDEPCYRALYKSGFPDDFETLLPTAQGRAVEHIARSDTEMMAAIRETRRKADSKRRGNKPTR